MSLLMKVPFEYFFGRLEFTTIFQYVFFEFDSISLNVFYDVSEKMYKTKLLQKLNL